jgi:ribosomal protein S12 methylthiotransferase
VTDRSAPIPGRGAKTRRVGFISLGCAKNLIDTEVMLGHLGEAGWELVQDPAEADVIVVNTCSFIGPAREESIQTILEAAEYKKTGRLQRLVVAGCMVQRNADELRLNLPEIDDYVDHDELPHIVARVSGSRTATPAQSALPVVSAKSGPISCRLRSENMFTRTPPARLGKNPARPFTRSTLK